MRFIAMMGLGFCVFVTGLTLPTTDANAVVCARGFYRAGCVGPHGAVGVRRGYYHGARGRSSRILPSGRGRSRSPLVISTQGRAPLFRGGPAMIGRQKSV